MLHDFIPRLYQQTILGTAAHKNTLVVLPTGLGKTGIALLLTAQRLHQYPHSKILLLAPTKPLCEQHVETFRKHLEIPLEKIVCFTGSVSPEKRELMWKDAQIIIATPQGLENDVINQRVKLDEVSLLVFDECHHAVGDYSYVWLAQQYDKLAKYPRILALTASPGSDMEKIKEICKNLSIEKVEVRTEKDLDVRQYVQEISIGWIKVEFPGEYKQVQKYLKDCLKSKLIEMQQHGYANSAELTKGELLMLQGELQQKISSGQHDFEMLRSISLLAEALKVEHALELVETQGMKPLYKYIAKLQQEALTSKVKATKNLSLDLNFKSAAYLAGELVAKGIDPPKILKLRELVEKQMQENSEAKIIIFTQYRDTAEEIIRCVSALNIKNHIFVGQAKKDGLGFSQKQQKEILDKFRNGEFNVLCSTSVGEEGLDIPKVDKVIFYEPIPSAIRSIQRRGRTGRLEKGEVTILVTVGTRDEAYRWTAFHKEKGMHRHLEALKREFQSQQDQFSHQLPKDQVQAPVQSGLAQFDSVVNSVIAILADHREKDNKVVKELIELGISVKTVQLEAADYVVSGRVGVELKKIPDFVDSIIDGRLLEQARDLKKNFERAVVIIEGEEDIYSVRKVHANAIRGMLASIVLDFGVPVLYTKNPRDTAGLLAVMAKREQDKSRDFSYHERKPHALWEQQEFFVSSLPNIGVQTARKLLERFGSVKSIVNASREELISIDGVGEKTAERIRNLFEGEYKKE
ncbi:DEAD/DEAH box helicase [Candidatus Woesearchaeota archaeon]|nr:DEAD/DEAH box helicase [Candidatus Woesearchaeota archaeon]